MAMFFALNNALLDASIAAWDAKRAYDRQRPIAGAGPCSRGRPSAPGPAPTKAHGTLPPIHGCHTSGPT